ncbi:MAG: phytanoyl-CoA dioxygenase family protein [Opitutaceae bacterium]
MPETAPQTLFSTTRNTPELTADDVAHYRENGYLVVADAFTPAELTVLKREAVRLCRGELGEFRGLQSAMADETDEAVIARYLCVHDPHKISEVYRRFMAHPVLVDVLTRIIGANVKCVQSMYFIKSAGKPGQAWHQDEMFIPTRDRSLTATWVAIDDAHRGNGCLRVIPTSHRSGVIWDCRDNSDEGQFGVTVESCEFPYREEEEVVLEVKAGTAVFFSGYLLHRSFRNDMQQGYRQAYANHYMSAESFLPWRLQEPLEDVARADCRDVEIVAGIDPYAHHGYADIVKPRLRASTRRELEQDRELVG